MSAMLKKLNMKTVLKIAALATAGLGLSGCYVDSSDGYYSLGYNDYGCDPYNNFDSYYGCDNGYGFSNIGYGGGWFDNYYYPGYGIFLFDSYGRRFNMGDNHRRHWSGQRYEWQRGRGRGNYYQGGNYSGGVYQGGGYGRDGHQGGGHHGGGGHQGGGHQGGGHHGGYAQGGGSPAVPGQIASPGHNGGRIDDQPGRRDRGLDQGQSPRPRDENGMIRHPRNGNVDGGDRPGRGRDQDRGQGNDQRFFNPAPQSQPVVQAPAPQPRPVFQAPQPQPQSAPPPRAPQARPPRDDDFVRGEGNNLD